MNNQQAQQLIKDTFETTFDKGRFSGFVRNLLNHIEDAPFTYQGNYIPEKFRQYIKTLERIGKYNDGEHTLDILIITLQKETSLERARTMQRNFIAWYLNGSRGGEMKDSALVAYVSPDYVDWRFSLVKMDYKFEKTKTGKMKVKEEFTPARRWSFLVGVNEKSHTAQSRLVKILADDEQAPTLAELEEAFNIETVTKEFFLKYRELFLRTKEALDKVVKKHPNVKADFDAKGVDTVNFAKKLLGQIVFLYFLQKKGWFGVGRDDAWGTGSKQFLRELFSGRHGNYQNFFNDILEPLFYEALRINRSHDDDYYSRFNCKIPFLNGGLFDPICNYDWVYTDIHLPNDLFSNTRKTNEGDIGDGILDVFDRYNFTVREDEPLEKEVAIDPELLGKAYEKFNAIRPDNFGEFTNALKSGKKGEENKFNKKFGVYYTPREIVHYMCKQSLINYLATRSEEAKLETPISKQDIEDLIEVGEMITEHEATALIKEQSIKNGIQKSTEYTALLSDGIRDNAKHIDDWLADITVCDPAAGSGAFPVGMMNEIVRARNVLSVFLNNQERSDYEFKRRCIEHSLYGVDIDPGAVEIAKLRLWLSLVVDEEDIKNIKPLPNLDYKIMQGNSIIELLSSEMSGPTDYNRTKLVQNLKQAKGELFDITNPTRKENKRSEINKLIRDLIEYDRKKQIERLKDKITAIKSQLKLFEDAKKQKEEEEKVNKITAKISEIDDLEFPGPSEHFEWHINFSDIFQDKGGFDVVIANPPYVRADSGPEYLAFRKKLEESKTYKTLYEKWDLMVPFIERGLNIANPKGALIYIVSNAICTSKYAFKLLDLIQEECFTHSINYFEEMSVFEAGVVPVVLHIGKTKGESITRKIVHRGSFENMVNVTEIESKKFKSLGRNAFRKEYNPVTLKAQVVDLGDICYISYGLRPNSDERFWKGEFTTKDVVSTKKSKIFCIPFVEGKDLDYYRIKRLRYLEWNTDRVPYKIARQTFPELYLPPKIIRGRMNPGVYDCKETVCSANAIVLKSLHDLGGIDNRSLQNFFKKHEKNRKYLQELSKDFDLKYLLSILNSRYAFYYLNNIRRHKQKNYFYPDDLKKLPIREISLEDQKPFIIIVDRILTITKSEDYLQNSQKQARVKELEREIDQMIYQLYGLTEEEICIVEGEGQ